jgi:hypothetical protein
MKATTALIVPIKWRFSVTPKGMNSDFRAAFRLWPQVLVTAGAVGSIVVGSYLYYIHHHLPEGAFFSNLLWLTMNTALAIKALGFVTSRMRQRRGGHRFPLPVIARITVAVDGEKREVFAIADDISSHGLNLAVDSQFPPESRIEGSLLLPTGPAPFRGSVLRTIQAKGAPTKLLGVELEWVDGSDGDALNRCLYGNTLQWDVNSWSEIRGFSLARFLPAWLATGRNESRQWKMGRLRAGHQAIDCLVRKEGATFRILSYSSLPATAGLRLRAWRGDNQAGLQVTGYREYVIGGASVHLAILATEPLNSAGFHREPSWVRT